MLARSLRAANNSSKVAAVRHVSVASRVLRQEAAQHTTPANGELYLKPMGKDFNMNRVRDFRPFLISL